MSPHMEYPGHYQLKRNRVIVLDQTERKCQVCGGQATVVHHIDCTKTNHAPENLMPLCSPCHGQIHTGSQNRTSKFIRLYQMTLREIAEYLELSMPTTHALLSGKRKNYHPLTLKRFQWFLLEYAKKRIGQ